MTFLTACGALVASDVCYAQGLTYVDADDGVNGAANLSPLASINITEPPVSNDNIWNYRSDGGVVNSGSFLRSVYEASGGTTAEDVPEIVQTLTGLADNTM